MKLDKISENLLKKVANFHKIPSGAVSIRVNGNSEIVTSSPNIEIKSKKNGLGLDIFVSSNCRNEACHIPVIVNQDGLFDVVYNDFYIDENAVVTIVAGCGMHSNSEAWHNGVHTFHLKKNACVSYFENHLALGNGKKKNMSPVTVVKMDSNSKMRMETSQLGGVDFADRKVNVIMKDNAVLEINEKILTEKFDVAKTEFKVTLNGENSKCTVVSKSVAKQESEQIFKSYLIGKNKCFGHVECDGILLDNARITSTPQVSAKHNQAALSHEASIGKIADEQILKLRCLGLSEKQAEQKIIEGFLK